MRCCLLGSRPIGPAQLAFLAAVIGFGRTWLHLAPSCWRLAASPRPDSRWPARPRGLLQSTCHLSHTNANIPRAHTHTPRTRAAVFLDVTQKGALLDGAAARSRFPNLDFAVSSSLDSRRARSASGGGGASIVGVWSEMARTMVTAHQRRGESDLVAHWLYQAMALDTRAPEWPHSMSARQ